MVGAVLYNLLPIVKGSYQLLMEQWLLAPILVVGVLILFWRHTILAYGDIKFSQGWGMLGAIFLLLAVPYLFGISLGNNTIIQLILVVLMMDRIVNSLAARRSTFYVFDIGFFIGLLSMLHAAYLILLPYFIYKFCQLKICTFPHVLAQVLGTVTVWVLLVFLFAEPSVEGVIELLSQKINPLLQPAIPKLSDVPLLFGLVFFLSAVWLIYYRAYRGSIERVRYLYRSHIAFACFLFIIHVAYGCSPDNFVLGFMLISLFFFSSPAFYFTSVRKGRKNYLALFYTISFIVFTIALWRGLFFPGLENFSFFSLYA